MTSLASESNSITPYDSSPGDDDASARVIADCKAKIRAIYRDASGLVNLDLPIASIPKVLKEPGGVLWIDVEDPGGADNHGVESMLRDVFHFHPLAIEDALKETHIPKVDDWGDYLYLVFSSIDFDPSTHQPQLHELDLFLGRDYLLTYHNEPLATIEQIRKNIERDPDHRLKRGADHLLYYVLDGAVGAFLPVLEHLDETIDTAQDEVFDDPTPQTLHSIFKVKQAAGRLHRMISPMREVVNRLARDTYPMIDEPNQVYFRDVYDHLVRIHDISESLRDLISGALETYLSVVSNRTNDIMKALTFVTVLFLPLTFLVGFFGMNFFGESLSFSSPLPKQLFFWGTIVLMVASPPIMYRWVKRKGWY